MPSDYTLGIVNFQVLVQTKTKRQRLVHPDAGGLVAADDHEHAPAARPGRLRARAAPPRPRACDIALYADSVNGRGPRGAPRPIGCTQTNVFKRGEQFVAPHVGIRPQERRPSSRSTTSPRRTSPFPASANVNLNWGAHGPQQGLHSGRTSGTSRRPIPLGDMTVIQIQFTTITGKVGKLAYPITIIP